MVDIDLDKYWDVKLIDCSNKKLKSTLPNNTDTFNLVVDKKKRTFDVTNNTTYFGYVRNCALAYKELASLANKGKTPKFTDIDIYKMLSQYNIISVLATPIHYKNQIKFQISYWMKDYDSTTNLYKVVNIEQLVNVINDVFEITNFKGLIGNVEKKLMTIVPEFNNFTHLNLAPSHITLFNNGVLNTKTFEFSTDINAFGEYDFITKINYRFLNPKNTKPEHRRLIDKLFHDWMEDDDEKIKLLKQLSLAVIDGNGRDTYVIIIGAGGNGKSVYITMQTKLASGYDANLDMQDIGNDNKLHEIDESTKLIVGHELATNAKFTGNMISRIKQMATGDPIKVDVKFKDARNVIAKCIKIQATNTIPKIFENNNAILRRIKLVQWTNKNFSKLESNIDLYALIEDPEFMEAYISYIFTDTAPFTRFIDVKSIEEDSANAVNDADQVYQFLNHLQEQEQMVGKVPTNVLYKMYDCWNREENPGSKPLKAKEFMFRVKSQLDKFDLSISENQYAMSKLKPTEFNLKVLNKYFYDYKLEDNKYKKSRVLIMPNQITDDDLLEVQMKLGTYEMAPEDFYDYKNMLILQELIRQGDTDAIGMNEMIEDLG